MPSFSTWLSALRLRTLPLALSCILAGTAAAASDGYYNSGLFILSIATTLLLQILSNLANDYGDSFHGADNEGRIGPRRAVQSGGISASKMKSAMVTTALLSFISGLLLLWTAFRHRPWHIALLFLLLGLGAIWAAVKYTTGKHPYGYKGYGDLFVFMFFGFVGVAGSYYLQTATWRWEIVFPALTIGSFCTAVLHLNNMRDRINDAGVHKTTLSVRLGFERSKYYFYFLLIAGIIGIIGYFSLESSGSSRWLLLLCLPMLLGILLAVKKTREEKDFDLLLKPMALTCFFYSICMALHTYMVNG